MVILEAMAAGKPIVATDVGGVADAVQNEKTGFLVPVGDVEAFAAALVRLASDAELAARMGRAGREAYEIDSRTTHDRRYADVLDTMIVTRRGHGPGGGGTPDS